MTKVLVCGDVHFADDAELDEIILLDVSECLLRELIVAGDGAVRGVVSSCDDVSVSAVVVCGLNTHSCRLTESSNIGFVVRERAITAAVTRTVHVAPALPKPNALRRLLSERVYRGDTQIVGGGLSAEYLASASHYSDALIQRALRGPPIFAMEIRQNEWAQVDADFAWKVCDAILTALDATAQSYRALSPARIVECLTGVYDADIVRWALNKLADGAPPTHDDIQTLSPRAIALHYASALFAQRDPYPLPLFLEEWRSALPVDARVDVTLLDGFAITINIGGSAALKYFPETQLDDDRRRRIASLFHVKPQWTLKELAPFIQPTLTNNENIETAILQHARSVAPSTFVAR